MSTYLKQVEIKKFEDNLTCDISFDSSLEN